MKDSADWFVVGMGVVLVVALITAISYNNGVHAGRVLEHDIHFKGEQFRP